MPLKHICGKDLHKILNSHVVVNPRIDGFGLFGAGKFNTKCVGMEFATVNITLHDGDYPDQETIFAREFTPSLCLVTVKS